jgi:hypothetical protein
LSCSGIVQQFDGKKADVLSSTSVLVFGFWLMNQESKNLHQAETEIIIHVINEPTDKN